MTLKLDGKVPPGPVRSKWDSHKFNLKLVNPSKSPNWLMMPTSARWA